jgi:nucleotide-binding universal stress UspA family protein
MKNILIPTDFSDCAKEAEQLGLELAKKYNSEIHFLHLLHTPVDWVNLPLEKEEFYPEVKEKIGFAQSELSRLKREAKKKGINAQTFFVYDKGQEEIDFHIKHHEHDFIIMGSFGAKGVKEIVGTNTQRVVRFSPVPVLVIKKKPKNIEFNDIVFASTFEEEIREPFKKVLDLGVFLEAKIHLLNVNVPYNFQETDEVESKMHSFLSKNDKEICTINIYNALNEERGIQKFSESITADVIALTTHGRSGIMKMISPSITESLVNHSNIPVLSINLKS